MKPLNKILAKSDDIIFKQMNFWRDQFESRRLIDFLTPNKLLQEPNTKNELLDIKKSRLFQKSVDYDLANSNQWHRKSAENIITEELRTIQNTLMVIQLLFKLLVLGAKKNIAFMSIVQLLLSHSHIC